MLTFKQTNIIFTALLAGLIVMHLIGGISLLWILLAVIAYSLVLFYGSYFVHSNFFLPVICSGPSTAKQMAISFDDGPANLFTPEVLKILKAENVAAAFFCIGKNIPNNEALLRQIHEEGHMIGNHSFSHHFFFDFFTAEKMLDDLRQMDAALADVLPVSPRLFRPPYGVTTPPMRKALAKGKYLPVGWNIRSMDTVTTDAQQLVKKVTGSFKPGAILLFHDTVKTTVEALPHIIAAAKKSGYELVRLDKLINEEAYA